MDRFTCCFTGHRPQSLPWGFDESDQRCVLLKQRLRDEIVRMITLRSVTHFISGMALGVDIWAAEAVLELKARYSIMLECAIPCGAQTANWSETARRRWNSVVDRCDKIALLQTRCTTDCFQKRNRYMIDHSDFVIAVWNDAPSGTGSTVAYARSKRKTLVIIKP